MKTAFCAAALLFATGALATDGPNLRVIATGIKSDQGKVYVWVYDKKDDWLSDRYRTQKYLAVAGNRTGDRLTIELLLPAGEYALSVFQDVNDNGKLERNFIGIPKEPAGLSNNLRPRFGPPKYKDAAFTVAVDTVTEQKIVLQ
jgi:uncharacterized protein (DUF2141 family)